MSLSIYTIIYSNNIKFDCYCHSNLKQIQLQRTFEYMIFAININCMHLTKLNNVYINLIIFVFNLNLHFRYLYINMNIANWRQHPQWTNTMDSEKNENEKKNFCFELHGFYSICTIAAKSLCEKQQQQIYEK